MARANITHDAELLRVTGGMTGPEIDCPSHARLGTGGMTPAAMVGSRALAPGVAPRPVRAGALRKS